MEGARNNRAHVLPLEQSLSCREEEDFHQVNSCIIRDSYPLPLVNETLEEALQHVGPLHCTIPMEESSKEYTEFSTHGASTSFVSYPLGLPQLELYTPVLFSKSWMKE